MVSSTATKPSTPRPRPSLLDRARALLETRRILPNPRGAGFLVESARPGQYYLAGADRCTCPAFTRDTERCKHSTAISMLLCSLQDPRVTCPRCHGPAGTRTLLCGRCAHAELYGQVA